MAVSGGKVSFVAPGIYAIERDLSQVPPAAARIGGAFIGLTIKGPAFIPRRINNFGEFRTIFGGFWKYSYLPYTVNAYFQGGAPVATVVRVLGKGGSSNLVDYNRPFVLAFPAYTASLNYDSLTAAYTANLTAVETLAVLRSRIVAGIDQVTQVGVVGTPTNFTLEYTGPGGSGKVYGLSLNRTDKSYIKNILGVNPIGALGAENAATLYVDNVLDFRLTDITGALTATYSGAGSCLGSNNNAATAVATLSNGLRYVTGGYSAAHTPWIKSQPFYAATGDTVNGTATVYDLFRVWSLADGESSNKDFKLYIQDVQTSSDNTTDLTIGLKFTLLVRQFNDTDARPVILESYRVDLDPESNYYIAKMIGDRYFTTVITNPGDTPVTKASGDYPNMSKFVRIEMGSSYPFLSRPAGFAGPAGINPGLRTDVAGQTVRETDYPILLSHLTTSGDVSKKIYPGFRYDGTAAQGYSDRLKASFNAVDGAVAAKGFLLLATDIESPFKTAAITANNNNSLTSQFNLLDVMLTGTAASVSGISTGLYQFGVPVFGGSDGYSPSVNPLEAINNGTLSAEFNSALATVANPDEIDMNLLVVPGVHSGANGTNGSFTNSAIQVCEDRGDCFYIMDSGLTTNSTTGAMDSSAADVVASVQGYDTNYAATYFPWVRIFDTDINRMVWVPPSVVAAGVYAFTDSIAAPWHAPAGVNRGMLASVLENRLPLAQETRESLYTGRVNMVVKKVNLGIFIDGQKTLQAKASSLDRVNVRRLMIYVKKVIAGLALQVQYENNTPRLRAKLKNLIEPALQSILLRNGIIRFQVVVDDTNNTPDSIDRNILQGTILIEPSKAAEVIILTYNLTRSGASFSEVLQNIGG